MQVVGGPKVEKPRSCVSRARVYLSFDLANAHLARHCRVRCRRPKQTEGCHVFFHKGAAFLTVLLQYFLGLLVGVILCFTWAFCGSLK